MSTTDPAVRPPKPRPAPRVDPDSAPYFEAAHEGRLVVQRCVENGHIQLYGRDRCNQCASQVAWVSASGRGTIYSFTVIRQNYIRPFSEMVPYVVALIDLVEGPRVMTNVVGCEPDEVEIGMSVRARFEPVSDTAGIALFELDR